MKTTKPLLTAFAVIASFLMLVTTTIAGPIQEKTLTDSIEQAQETLINSLDNLLTKIQNDQELNLLSEQIENDRQLVSISNLVKRTSDADEKVALATDYISTLNNKPAYNSLKELLKSKYSQDLSYINYQSNELSKLLETYIGDNTESDDYEIGGALPLAGAVYPVTTTGGMIELSGSSTNMGSIDSIITSSGSIIILPDASPVQPIIGDGSGSYSVEGSTEAQWVSFLRNMDGDIYVPGEGWISTDDPNYNFWLNIEDALQDSDLTLGDILAILCIICYVSLIPTYILAIIAVTLGFESLGSLLLYMFICELYGIYIFAFLNALYFAIYPPE